MAKVNFTYALKRFFPDLKACEINAADLKELIDQIEKKFPGLKNYLLEDHGALRKHVNIFVDDILLSDRTKLSDNLTKDSIVYIMQALSGG